MGVPSDRAAKMTRYIISEFLWRRSKTDPSLVRVWCPLCNASAVLDHVIDDDGKVDPSLDCPNPECIFHEMVQLENWKKVDV